MRVVGVIPSAGRAERLQPLPCSKEMIRIGERRLIDWIVERMRAGGADELRIVTRPDKRDVAEYAEAIGATLVLGEPPSLSRSLALGLAGLSPDAVGLIGFPDSIWEPRDGFHRLVAALGPGRDVALGLFRWDEPERSDVVSLAKDGTVTRIECRPRRPVTNLVWGCAAARARALVGLGEVDEPGELFGRLCAEGRVTGIELSDCYDDLGTKEALARARAAAYS